MNVQLDKRGRLVNHIGGRLQLPAAEAWGWRTKAACNQPGIDPEWFWSNTTADIVSALTVCETCPVRPECGTEQARIQSAGVWAGVRWLAKNNDVYPDNRRFLIESAPKRRRKLRRRRVLVLTLRGMKAPQIADVLGVHRQTVKNDLEALGF